MIAATEELALPLSAAHAKKLFDDAGISAEVINARGYQTITKESHGESYKENGWGGLVRSMPALEIPIWNVHGRAACPQIRPDNPRLVSGKVIKYEWPRGENLCLDVNPLLLDRVKGTEPLVITEGVIKSDAAISRGLCAIGLLGVYGFRGRNIYGGITAFDDWQYINLKQRDVYIAFDSDVVQKPQVQKALTALRTFLQGKGAIVHTVYLPGGPEGEKVGLDDYFHDHTASDFWGLANGDPDPKDIPIQDIRGTEFVERNDMLCVVTESKDVGRVARPLCNFTARIDSIVQRDDGVQVQRQFNISGHNVLGRTLPTISIPSDEFAKMAWIEEHWPGLTNVEPGKATRDFLRAALVDLSTREGEIPSVTTYSHTGWRRIGTSWYYLSAAGGLGEHGADSEVLVDPDGLLRRVELLDPDDAAVRSGVRASLDLLDLGEDDLLAPILAATYLAPIAELITPNFVTHIVGRTGSFKTEVAALMQGHFGKDFNAQSLPGSWQSTANYMEYQSFIAKDAVIVMDDFRPTGGYAGQAMHQKAETFIRGVGNSSGRGRLNSNATARRTYSSRGVVLSTGEDIPNGESLRARMAIVEVGPRSVDAGKLTIAQGLRDSGTYTNAISGYVKWLAPQMDTLGERIRARHAVLIKELGEQPIRSMRTPYICAMLQLSFELFCGFAKSIGAITTEEYDAYVGRAYKSIVHGMPAQMAALAEEDESARFVEAIASGLVAGRCHLRSSESLGWEDGLENCGWSIRDHAERVPQGAMVGYVDFKERCVMLLPEEAYAFAVSSSNRYGHSIGLTKRRLWKNLLEAGLIQVWDADRFTVRKTVLGRRVRVVVLPMDLLGIPATPAKEEVIDNYSAEIEADQE